MRVTVMEGCKAEIMTHSNAIRDSKLEFATYQFNNVIYPK